MPDLLWADVADWFDPASNGPLPDGCVRATTLDDWQAVVSLVRARGWAYEYLVDGRVTRPPAAVAEMFSLRGEAGVVLKVWPTRDIQVNFWFSDVNEIDFDVALRELQGQERLDVLCAFLRAIGRRLGKPVVLTFEGAPDAPLLGYDVEVDRVMLMVGQARAQ